MLLEGKHGQRCQGVLGGQAKQGMKGSLDLGDINY